MDCINITQCKWGPISILPLWKRKKTSGRQGVEIKKKWKNQIIEHKHSVIFFFFYRHITWRALWDFRLALSAKTKSCVSPFFPHTEAEDFWNKPTDTQLWHFITLSSYSWSVGKEAWSNNLRCVSIHLTNVKSNFHSNSCSLTTHERNVFTLLKPY